MIAAPPRIRFLRIAILGITFKENCPDVRNTKSIDVVQSLKSYGVRTSIYDPWADEEEVKKGGMKQLFKTILDVKNVFDVRTFPTSNNIFAVNFFARRRTLVLTSNIFVTSKNVTCNKLHVTTFACKTLTCKHVYM